MLNILNIIAAQADILLVGGAFHAHLKVAMEILILAVLIGLIPAVIAHSKGHSFAMWWFFGAMLFIVALPMAILISPNSHALEQRQISAGGMRKCPACAELIKDKARICRFCGTQLAGVPAR